MIPVTSIATTVQSVGSALADAAVAAAASKPKRTRSTPSRAGVLPRKRPSQSDPLRGLVSAPAIARTARLVASAVRNRRTTPGYASTARASSAPKNPLAFLNDPKLSIEEKLMRLLAYQSEKWQKEMQEKLNEIAAHDSGESSKASSSKKKSSGGVLGGVADAFGKAFGGGSVGSVVGAALKVPGVRTALEKLGGPALGAAASALGFPQAAPLLAKHGGKVLVAAANAASSLGSGASQASGATGNDSGTKEVKQKLALMQIQALQEKQQEMFGLVSGILRATHNTRMGVIGNIR